MKKLLCYLFHKITFVDYNFTDVVSGKMVNDYHCKKCNKTFMSNSKYNLFRVYKD